MKKYILIGFGIAVIAAVSVALYMYNKKVPTLEDVTPDFVLTADELFDAFDTNETEALKEYENKVIEVKGEVMSVKNSENQSNIILKAEMAMAGGVNCSFNYPQEANIEKGMVVSIKGRCQGYLLDVVLNNCYLIP